jgi:hypothetical protein
MPVLKSLSFTALPKVLEIASVVGREISTSILDAVAGLAPAELSEAAQHLRQIPQKV